METKLIFQEFFRQSNRQLHLKTNQIYQKNSFIY